MCRNSNIPVSGSMLQEEATLIAEKLEISDFVAPMAGLKNSIAPATKRSLGKQVT